MSYARWERCTWDGRRGHKRTCLPLPTPCIIVVSVFLLSHAVAVGHPHSRTIARYPLSAGADTDRGSTAPLFVQQTHRRRHNTRRALVTQSTKTPRRGCWVRCRRQPPGPSGCRLPRPTPATTARRPHWRKADWLSAAASGVGTQERRAVVHGSGGASRTAPTSVGASAAASGNRDTGTTASGVATSRPAQVDGICDRTRGGGTVLGASVGGGASAIAAPGDDTGWAATGPILAASGVRAAGAAVDGDTDGGAVADVGQKRAFCCLPLTLLLAGACVEASAAAAAARYARLPRLPALVAALTMSCGR